MIEIIKEWTMTMCVTAVAGALAGMTAPKAGVGKIFKITLSTFFLCCMIMPFFSARDTISFDFSNSGTDYQVSDDEIDEMLREQTLFNAKNIIESDLNEYIEEKTDFSAQLARARFGGRSDRFTDSDGERGVGYLKTETCDQLCVGKFCL